VKNDWTSSVRHGRSVSCGAWHAKERWDRDQPERWRKVERQFGKSANKHRMDTAPSGFRGVLRSPGGMPRLRPSAIEQSPPLTSSRGSHKTLLVHPPRYKWNGDLGRRPTLTVAIEALTAWHRMVGSGQPSLGRRAARFHYRRVRLSSWARFWGRKLVDPCHASDKVTSRGRRTLPEACRSAG